MNNNNRRPGAMAQQSRAAAQRQMQEQRRQPKEEARTIRTEVRTRQDPRVPREDPRRRPDPRVPREQMDTRRTQPEPRRVQPEPRRVQPEPRRAQPDYRRQQDPRMMHQQHHSSGLLDVLGMGLAAVVNAASEAKEQEFIREQQMLEREAEEKKVMNDLLSKIPAVCPHCGAPTSRQLNCEYCDSYLVNNTEN